MNNVVRKKTNQHYRVFYSHFHKPAGNFYVSGLFCCFHVTFSSLFALLSLWSSVIVARWESCFCMSSYSPWRNLEQKHILKLSVNIDLITPIILCKILLYYNIKIGWLDIFALLQICWSASYKGISESLILEPAVYWPNFFISSAVPFNLIRYPRWVLTLVCKAVHTHFHLLSARGRRHSPQPALVEKNASPLWVLSPPGTITCNSTHKNIYSYDDM